MYHLKLLENCAKRIKYSDDESVENAEIADHFLDSIDFWRKNSNSNHLKFRANTQIFRKMDKRKKKMKLEIAENF